MGSSTFIYSPQAAAVTDFWQVFDFVVNESGDIDVQEVNEWITGFDARVMPPSGGDTPR